MQDDDALVVLDGLATLANLQDERLLTMRAQERKSGLINPHLDTAIRVLKDLLVSIQEMRFDLGLDEYRRRTPREQIAAAAEKEARTQREVYEAYEAMNAVFDRLNIRKASDEEAFFGRESGSKQ